MSLRKKAYNALFWSFIDRGGEQTFRFIFSIILARLLLPEHFGLIGMAYVVTELARVFVQSGFGLALINNREAGKIDECSVFYFNIAIGALLTTILIFFSPLIGTFFKSTELVPIIRYLSLNVLIGSFGIIQTALMTKNVDFKAQTKVSVTATIISGIVGVLLAYANYGVWALVIQILIRNFLHSLFLWLAHSWRPELQFSFGSLRKMFGFGSKLLLTSIIQRIFMNIHTILIGKFFPPAQLGFYTRANQTQQLPLDTFWVIIGRVTFPILSTIKNEPVKLKQTLAKASGNMAFAIFPTLIIVSSIAPNLFLVLFGEKWLPSVLMFQILCFANLFNPLELLRSNVIVAKGNSSLHLQLQIFKYVTITGSVIASFNFGIYGMLIAFGLASYITFLVYSYFISKEIGYTLFEQLKDLTPYLLCAGITGIITYSISLLQLKNLWITSILQIITGFTAYGIGCFVLRANALKDSLDLVTTILQNMFNISINPSILEFLKAEK